MAPLIIGRGTENGFSTNVETVVVKVNMSGSVGESRDCNVANDPDVDDALGDL
jgi:hypothetical protein